MEERLAIQKDRLPEAKPIISASRGRPLKHTLLQCQAPVHANWDGNLLYVGGRFCRVTLLLPKGSDFEAK